MLSLVIGSIATDGDYVDTTHDLYATSSRRRRLWRSLIRSAKDAQFGLRGANRELVAELRACESVRITLERAAADVAVLGETCSDD